MHKMQQSLDILFILIHSFEKVCGQNVYMFTLHVNISF
jgi:hypothetical protein